MYKKNNIKNIFLVWNIMVTFWNGGRRLKIGASQSLGNGRNEIGFSQIQRWLCTNKMRDKQTNKQTGMKPHTFR